MTSDQQAKLDRLLNELSNLGYDCGLAGVPRADGTERCFSEIWAQSQAKKKEILRFVEGLGR